MLLCYQNGYCIYLAIQALIEWVAILISLILRLSTRPDIKLKTKGSFVGVRGEPGNEAIY